MHQRDLHDLQTMQKKQKELIQIQIIGNTGLMERFQMVGQV